MAAAENHDLAQRVEKLEAERDALAAELKTLKYILFRSLLNITGDDWRESASKAIKGYSPYQSKPTEAGIFEKAEVARLKRQFERYPCGCTDWEKQHCRGETSPFAEHPDCQRMQPPEAGG